MLVAEDVVEFSIDGIVGQNRPPGRGFGAGLEVSIPFGQGAEAFFNGLADFPPGVVAERDMAAK